jgi:hypothetical protein
MISYVPSCKTIIKSKIIITCQPVAREKVFGGERMI